MDTVSLADPSACIVEHSILHAKVLNALASNNAAMVLRRTGWIATESCIVVKVIVFELHLSILGGTNMHFHVETPLQDVQGGGQPVLTGDIQSYD